MAEKKSPQAKMEEIARLMEQVMGKKKGPKKPSKEDKEAAEEVEEMGKGGKKGKAIDRTVKKMGKQAGTEVGNPGDKKA